MQVIWDEFHEIHAHVLGQDVTLTALGPAFTEMHIQMPVNHFNFDTFFHS